MSGDGTKEKKLLRTGLVGSAVAAVCCFTPILVVALAGAGLSAIVGWLDYGLFPALFAFLGITAYALYLRAGRVGPSPKGAILAGVVLLSLLIIWLDFRFALRISLVGAAAVAGYALYLHRASARHAST